MNGTNLSSALFAFLLHNEIELKNPFQDIRNVGYFLHIIRGKMGFIDAIVQKIIF